MQTATAGCSCRFARSLYFVHFKSVAETNSILWPAFFGTVKQIEIQLNIKMHFAASTDLRQMNVRPSARRCHSRISIVIIVCARTLASPNAVHWRINFCDDDDNGDALHQYKFNMKAFSLILITIAQILCTNTRAF